MEHLFNQRILWESKIDMNGYGQPIYGSPKSIYVRWEDTVKIVKNHLGEEITSQALIFTSSPIKVDDKLTYDGETLMVQKASKIVTGTGEISHREVFV